MPPNELIRRRSCAPVDLLWNGGIGTYVKASTEAHADVGDKTNDAVRVDAAISAAAWSARRQPRAHPAGADRVRPGRPQDEHRRDRQLGGVDCSDHEVNIKILLDDAVVAAGDLTVKQRNELLVEMTD